MTQSRPEEEGLLPHHPHKTHSGRLRLHELHPSAHPRRLLLVPLPVVRLLVLRLDSSPLRLLRLPKLQSGEPLRRLVSNKPLTWLERPALSPPRSETEWRPPLETSSPRHVSPLYSPLLSLSTNQPLNLPINPPIDSPTNPSSDPCINPSIAPPLKPPPSSATLEPPLVKPIVRPLSRDGPARWPQPSLRASLELEPS